MLSFLNKSLLLSIKFFVSISFSCLEGGETIAHLLAFPMGSVWTLLRREINIVSDVFQLLLVVHGFEM